jgi:putative membrane protein insertion efficiency factor
LPELRPAVSRRRVWIKRALVLAIAALAIADWTRPPNEQLSVPLYERGVIGGYRLLIHPMTHFVIHCRYQPTCSRYSEDAVRVHGLPKGLILTAWRLVRCLPWVPAGTIDPVPPRS